MQSVSGVSNYFSVPPSPPVQLSASVPEGERPWNERAIAVLDVAEKRLDHLLPNSVFQMKIDGLGRAIEKKFAFFKTWNDWLDRHDMGAWYYQLAMFFIKLPQKVARNILNLLYEIFKAILCTAVHPLEAPLKLAKLLVKLAHALTLPETWVKMGAGMCGACIGQSLVSGNPISLIGVGIGAAMVLGGLTAGTIKSLILLLKGKNLEEEGKQLIRILKDIQASGRVEDLAASNLKAMQLIAKGETLQAQGKEQLIRTFREIPESTLTGLCLGLITGGIQRAIDVSRMRHYEATSMGNAEKFARDVMRHQDHLRMSPKSHWEYDPKTGKVIVDGPAEASWSPFQRIRIEIHPTKYTTDIWTKQMRKCSSSTGCHILYPANHLTYDRIPDGLYDHLKYPDSLLPPQPDTILNPVGPGAGAISTLGTSEQQKM